MCGGEKGAKEITEVTLNVVYKGEGIPVTGKRACVTVQFALTQPMTEGPAPQKEKCGLDQLQDGWCGAIEYDQSD